MRIKRKPVVAVAGRGAMGAPLLGRLAREEFPVAVSFTSRELWVGNERLATFPERLQTEADYAKVLDPYMKDVEVMFLAVPSGPNERALIDYCIKRQIYAVLFCKHALATHYAELRPHRYMLGANATVGGRTLSLPWLRMQYLEGKQFVLYAYWNASTNFFMHGVADSGSAPGMFEKAKDTKLAEPGSDDYASFLNAEIGGDYRLKVMIAMNDAMLGDGPFVTKDAFDAYVPLNKLDIRDRSLPTCNDRYLVRIDNLGLKPEFERGQPGTLYAKHGEFQVCGGFTDLSRNNSIAAWMRSGDANGVRIRFEGDHSHEGSVEMSGPGAGTATVGAAMSDLYQFIEATQDSLLENQWPRRAAA